MNILCTATSYPPAIGGAQYHAHSIAARLARSHKVETVCLWTEVRTDWLLGTTILAPSREARYEIDGVPVRRLGFSRIDKVRMGRWVPLYFLMPRPAVAAIAGVIQEKLAEEAQEADLVHNARIGREPLSYASYGISREEGVPFMLTPYHHPRWSGPWYREYHRLYRLADGLIALTEAEKRALIQLGVEEDRITVTGTGPVLAEKPDPDAFRARYGLEAPFVLFIGQKYRYKNLRALLGAAKDVWRSRPEVSFVLMGPRTADSRQLFAFVRDRRILELGEVSLQEKTDALAACAMLCQPSTQESFGAVFVEAWLLGKAVVGSDIPAVREVIASGEDGIVTDPTPKGFAEAILYLVEHPDRAREMAARGEAKAIRRFTWEVLARKTEEAYEHAHRRSGKGSRARRGMMP